MLEFETVNSVNEADLVSFEVHTWKDLEDVFLIYATN